MIHFMRDLAQFVAQKAQSVDALTSRLGAIQPAEADDPAVLIAPTDSRLTEVRIARLPDGSPFTIRLSLAHKLPIAELKAAFGEYKTLTRSDPDMAWPLIFTDAVRGTAADVSVLVSAAGPLDQLDQRDVDNVTLRIDPH